MQVTLRYNDSQSLTVEEVVRQAQHNYGNAVKIEISPDSIMAYDHIYLGLQMLLTHEQLSLLYDKGSNYQKELSTLRADVLYKVTEIIDQVIVDNESKVAP